MVRDGVAEVLRAVNSLREGRGAKNEP